MKAVPDHFRKRQKYKATDQTVIDACFKLTPAQFEAWKCAYLRGMSNIEISDHLCLERPDRAIFPSEVQALLEGCARRGFAIPGEDFVARPPRLTVVA